MQSTVSKLLAAGGQLLEKSLLICLPPSWQGLGNLAVSHKASAALLCKTHLASPAGDQIFQMAPPDTPSYLRGISSLNILSSINLQRWQTRTIVSGNIFLYFFSPRNWMASLWQKFLYSVLFNQFYTGCFSPSQTIPNHSLCPLLTEGHKRMPQTEQEWKYAKGPHAIHGVLVLQHYWDRWSTIKTHNLSHQGQNWIFTCNGQVIPKGFLYLLLEQLQQADFFSYERHCHTVGIPCCLDLGQLIRHQDSIHTYRHKAERLQHCLTCLDQQAQTVNSSKPPGNAVPPCSGPSTHSYLFWWQVLKEQPLPKGPDAGVCPSGQQPCGVW